MMTLKMPVTPDDHILGNPNAPLTLLEYGDYECAHCVTAHSVTQALQKHFGEQLRFVFRHFPLTDIHRQAALAAEASELAAVYGMFWKMHELIYENQADLSLWALVQMATRLGIPVPHIKDAFENRLYQGKVQTDFMGGVRSGVHDTPTFFINEEQYSGPPTFDELAAAIHQKTVAA